MSTGGRQRGKRVSRLAANELVRRIDACLGAVADIDTPRRSGADGSADDSDGSDGAAETVTVYLDELADLDVEREVRRLKSGRAPNADALGGLPARTTTATRLSRNWNSLREPPYRKH